MLLGREEFLDPGDIVLDGDPAPPSQKEGTTVPIFRPMSIVAKQLEDKDHTWYGGRPRPMRHSVKAWFHVKIKLF